MEDFERTIGYADRAVGHLKHDRVSPYPKAYEVWFVHLTGQNDELSKAINDIYEKYGRVSSGQIVHLHETFISENHLGDKVDKMGGKINEEATFLQDVIKKCYGMSQDFGKSLKQAAKDLEIDLDQHTLQKLIKRVSLETLAVEKQNEQLLEQLQVARAGIQRLHKDLEEVREETLLDQLTMIGNRRHFDRSLSQTLAECHLSDKSLCLIMADIDHFKNFNDTWGHQTGDQVLKLVALAVKGNVKTIDIPCRYGGEEFAIILPGTTLEQGKVIAERIRKTVAKRDVVKRSTGENLGRITISTGVSVLNSSDTPESLIHRADRCLYAAKKAGRNQVIVENDELFFKRSLKRLNHFESFRPTGNSAGFNSTDSPQPQADV